MKALEHVAVALAAAAVIVAGAAWAAWVIERRSLRGDD